ncbi:MAG: TIGR02757 family protein [Muribaculaceae bacterium]|nr:TIGR02757 family protein [Muribaculaceae bacterium]
MDSEIFDLLEREAARINNPDFINDDPVQFPRMFTDLRDIEIAALLCSTIAWGNRKMICRNCMKMLQLMDLQPYNYVMDRGYEDLPDGNVHRTFFNSDLRHYLRGLHSIYSRHDTLQDFARAHSIGDKEAPSWALAAAINDALTLANDGKADSRCLPQNLQSTALKRLNMALRWLVRNDGIVDMGVWDVITPAQLYIPLDVHVSDVARDLGLLARKSNDRKAVEQLTATLREGRPDDPVYYDYALFGIGIGIK